MPSSGRPSACPHGQRHQRVGRVEAPAQRERHVRLPRRRDDAEGGAAQAGADVEPRASPPARRGPPSPRPGARRRGGGPTRRPRTRPPCRPSKSRNSRRLAAKYASMSGWKSRWSWLRLVKAATAKRTPSTRRRSSAWEETSMAHARSPPSSMAAERRLQLDRLRRGAGDRRRAAGHHGGDRAQQPARPAGRLEQRAHEPGGRRLAARPRHPDHGQARGRVAVEAGRRAWPSPPGRPPPAPPAPRARAAAPRRAPPRRGRRRRARSRGRRA